MTSAASRLLVVSWIAGNARSEGLARALGARAVFMPWARPRQSIPRTVSGWLRSAHRTTRLVRSLPGGSVVVVMAPPVFAPLVCLLSARGRGVAVVVDAHSGCLNDARWSWSFGLMRSVMRRCSMVLVTNLDVLAGTDLGSTPVRVVHDPLTPMPAQGPGRVTPSLPLAVFPASGAQDEPLVALSGAADILAGSVEIFVTGRVPPPTGPSRLRRTGYLGDEEYRRLLGGANVVLALTTREATMQRAAYEALELGCPIVSSDTRVLREALGPAAVFVRNNAADIARGIVEALERREELAAATSSVVSAMLQGIDDGLAAVRELQRDGSWSP